MPNASLEIISNNVPDFDLLDPYLLRSPLGLSSPELYIRGSPNRHRAELYQGSCRFRRPDSDTSHRPMRSRPESQRDTQPWRRLRPDGPICFEQSVHGKYYEGTHIQAIERGLYTHSKRDNRPCSRCCIQS